MEKVKALKETIATFVENVEKVPEIADSLELDAIERKAVVALQLAEVQVAEAGDDLYHAVQAQRRAINSGLVVKKEEKKEEEDAGRDTDSEAKASKPRRAKRKAKKSTK